MGVSYEVLEPIRETSSDENDIGYTYEKSSPFSKSSRSSRVGTFFSLVLLISAVLNVSLLLGWIAPITHQTACSCDVPRSNFTKAVHVVPNNEIMSPFSVQTEYAQTSNLTRLDELWDSIHPDKGVVALPPDRRLRASETFPWDESKEIYMLEGWHSVHCLKKIYVALRQYQQNLPQADPFAHVMHCVDALRSNAMCLADDTPRTIRATSLSEAAARSFDEGPQAEYGAPEGADTVAYKTTSSTGFVHHMVQMRECRDWNALERYAERHSACFRRLPRDDPRFNGMDEWVDCPEDSPYKELADQYMASHSRS